MQKHVLSLTNRLIYERNLTSKSLVFEAASNDGYLLKHYIARGIPAIGIEPAANIAAFAEEENKVPTEVSFLNSSSAPSIARKYGQADVIHAHNVIAHTPNPVDFLSAIATILKPTGIAVIEAPYVMDLVRNRAFDTIYHEHYSYMSVAALHSIAERVGLKLIAVERTPIHGGSLIYKLAHQGTDESPTVSEFLNKELEIGLGSETYAHNFSERVQALCTELATVITGLHTSGKKLAAYGASAKGSTLLNFLGESAQNICFAVDRSPLKHGRYIPGIQIPIRPVEALLEECPDVALLLSWNFREEVISQQSEYLKMGGSFLIPIPKVEIFPTIS